ncbi:G patch domain-containing protein 3-like isoform X2 [Pollicipes pollicipes]|nr:G patch domain-containing protein 3-like isoform X2 [Pollicipes pollicipes]XP_037089866.1 G patch domain-containing protein 3-like isoform X2 [Pollicipes pollicipes]
MLASSKLSDIEDSDVVCIVHNIPKSFHSRDLRNYFSQFLEKGGFTCFHYRHRPEVQEVAGESEVPPEVGSLAPTASVRPEPDAAGGSPRRRPHAACCATVRLRRQHLAEFVRLYDKKHWVDSDGCYLSRRCFVSRLRLAAAADLRDMIEFRPPADMPRGNVGTPTAVFLQAIQRCQLPASLVRRLGLVFPRSARRRQYSSVPHDYGTGTQSEDEEEAASEETARTARGAELLDRLSERMRPPRPETRTELGPESSAPRASDELDAEECDRHESLHNDVTSQDRTKERLYEEEIELVWEKGGPGLVWYTDAVYWDQLQGDFDERTADDWDVDMAVYEPGAGPGDMDAREARQMRLERCLRDGAQSESAFTRRRDGSGGARRSDDTHSSGVGAFERHTRGFGRRVLLNLGWTEGRGLGTGAGGIAEPLEADGQTDRRGFGFVGERLERRPGRKRRCSGETRITSAYDDPRRTEIAKGVDHSLPPTHMKFRRPAPPA